MADVFDVDGGEGEDGLEVPTLQQTGPGFVGIKFCPDW